MIGLRLLLAVVAVLGALVMPACPAAEGAPVADEPGWPAPSPPPPPPAASAPSAPPAPPAPSSPAPALRASGESLWNLRYAWGNPEGLPPDPLYAAHRVTFEQQLRLRLEGDVAPGVTIAADLDNIRSDNLQLVGVDIKAGRTLTHLGDIQLQTASRYAATRGALTGARFTADLDAWQVGALAGRSRGIPASRTFYGGHSEERVRYVGRLPDGAAAPYAPTRDTDALVADIRGTQGMRLATAYDPEFTRVWLVPRDAAPDADAAGCGESPNPGSPTLRQWLDGHGLGALYGGPQPDPATGRTGVLRPVPDPPAPDLPPEVVARAFFALGSGQVAGVNTPAQPVPAYVLLQQESLALLRAHVEALIRRYNEINRLGEGQRLTYPFVRDSQADREFLTGLRQYYRLQPGTGRHPGAAGWAASAGPVGLALIGTCSAFREHLGTGTTNPERPGDASPPPDAPATPLYLLGHGEIDAGSLAVSVERPEGVTAPADTQGLRWDLYATEGVLRVNYPGPLDAFTARFRALQARFRYVTSEGIYFLGTAVAAGSERVTLNGMLLRRDIDYGIDYELGVLTLMRPIGPQDRLQVDFEYFRGGPGAMAEYNRNVFGLWATWRPAPAWQLSGEAYFAGDEPRPRIDPERVRTMPNAHTVLALSGSYRATPAGPAPAAPPVGAAPAGAAAEPPPSGGTGSQPVEGFWARWDAAWSHDVFPFDDNRRLPQANAVNGLAGSRVNPDPANGTGGLLVAAHAAGITVAPLAADGTPSGPWSRYATTAGLSGLTVYGIAPAVNGAASDGAAGDPVSPPAAWLLATESGLTMVVNDTTTPAGSAGPAPATAGAPSPFERAANWHRRYTSDGLPSNRLQDVLFAGIPVIPPGTAQGQSGRELAASVWVATDRGLAWADADGLATQPAAALRNWRVIDAASAPARLPDANVADLAMVVAQPEGGGSGVPALLAVTGAGVVWVPLGRFAAAAGGGDAWGDRVQTVLSANDVRRAAAVALPGGTVRIFAGTTAGLRYVDVRPFAAAGPSPPPAAVDGAAGKVYGLQLQPAADGRARLWIAAETGLYQLQPAADTCTGAPPPCPPGSPRRLDGAFAGAATALGLLPTGTAAGQMAATTAERVPGVAPRLYRADSQSNTLTVLQPPPDTPQDALPVDDPARFFDPAAPRVREGVAGTVTMGVNWAGGGVVLGYERVQPGFLAIDDITRQDLEQWQATVHHQLTPTLGVVLGHADWRTADPQAPQQRLRGLAEEAAVTWSLPFPAPATWASPPALRASVRHERLDRDEAAPEFEVITLTRSLQLEERLWQQRLVVAAGYENVEYQEIGRPSYAAHNITVDLSAAPVPEVSLTVRYRYPLKLFGPPQPSAPRVEGRPELQLGASATTSMGPVRTSLTLGQQLGWRIPDAGGPPASERIDRQLQLAASVPAIPIGRWGLEPSARLQLGQSERPFARSSLRGLGGSLRALWYPAAIELELSADRQFEQAEAPVEKAAVDDRVALRAATQAVAGVYPALTLSRTARVAALSAGPSQHRVADEASVTVDWATQSGWPQSTRLAARREQWQGPSTPPRGDRTLLQLTHTVRYEPGGPWSAALTGGGSAEETRWDDSPPVPGWQLNLSGQLEYRLSAQWAAGAEVGYARGVGPPGAPAGSGLWAGNDPSLVAGPTVTFASGWARLFARAVL